MLSAEYCSGNRIYPPPPFLHFLSDSSFQIAASMKLGAAMGEMSKPSKGGATKDAVCSSDNDCSSDEKCKNGNCVSVCSPSPCPSSEFCLNEGNHSYSCVECTGNEQCGATEICKNNVCVDACSGNPCASKGQACSSRSGHSYICYGCINNSGCSGGKVCDTATKSCTDPCPSGFKTGITCSSGYDTQTSGTSGGKACVKCVPKACGNGGYANAKEIGTTRPSCSTLSEWEIIETGKSGNATCYACVCKSTTFGSGGCCSGGKLTCGGKEGPCRECCNNNTNKCGSGKKCSNYKCVNCAKGESCYCPSGSKADGKGGCLREPIETGTPCFYNGNKPCPDGYFCSGTAKRCCPNGSKPTAGSCYPAVINRGNGADCEPDQWVNGRLLQGKCR